MAVTWCSFRAEADRCPALALTIIAMSGWMWMGLDG
jgi:hypothetical protein